VGEQVAACCGTSRLRRAALASVLALLLVIAGGLWLWKDASDGSKQADLGAGLVSTGGMGLLLVYFERTFVGESRNIRSAVSLGAAPPEYDTGGEAHSVHVEDHLGITDQVEVVVTDTDQFKVTETEHIERVPRLLRVQYDGWQRDTLRIDASSARLRVLNEDGTRFQFFTALVSGIGLRVALGSARGVTVRQFRRAFADLAVDSIRQAITDGDVPLNDTSMAFEVFPDADQAARSARSVEDREYEEGEIIAEFLV
jgi:hypothetical protein